MRKILLILMIATAAINCGNKKNSTATQDGKGGGAAAEVTQKAANGANVVSQNTLPPEKLTVINDAISNLIADAKFLGFTEDLDANAYTVYVVTNCEGVGDEVKAFRIRADDYDGSIYDKNPQPGIGEILAAEQVIMNFAAPSNSWKICDDNLPTMANTARYGLEHILLFHNRYDEYTRTANHANGTFHPLIGSRPQAAATAGGGN